MLTLAAVQTDAFGCEQLLQINVPETLNRQWEPADLANFDDSALANVNLLGAIVITGYLRLNN